MVREFTHHILQIVAIMQSYSAEIRMAKLPYFAQRTLFGLLAVIGKRFGYKPRYTRYSGAGTADV